MTTAPGPDKGDFLERAYIAEFGPFGRNQVGGFILNTYGMDESW